MLSFSLTKKITYLWFVCTYWYSESLGEGEIVNFITSLPSGLIGYKVKMHSSSLLPGIEQTK